MRLEAASGILLFISAVLAITIVNSPWQYHYDSLLHLSFSVGFSDFLLTETLLHWVNEGLMAIFFLLVGLEIKREVVQGELDTLSKSTLPISAAIGGMVAPALIYLIFTHHDSIALKGWAVPCATDIAFALGVLKLLGNRIPQSLKIFLMALAIFDDLGAILIIAFFYTNSLMYFALFEAFICVLGLFCLNYFNVRRLFPYIFIGVFLWYFILQSGIHATIAGVLVAMFIPVVIRSKDPEEPSHITVAHVSPLKILEKNLHPWVAFGILPLFAFFNAGLSFKNISLPAIVSPVPLGIALGLLIGKQVGIFSASWIVVKCRIARLPTHVSWQTLYGVAVVCGVGFTMSLFIGNLAFENYAMIYSNWLRLGVLLGSLLAGILGYSICHFQHPKKV